jgi:hypothetical protein
LEGATLSNKALTLSNDISMPLPPTLFKWKHKTSDKEESASKSDTVALPVYLNDTRADILFSIDLAVPSNVPQNVWYQRGVALSVWKSNI